MRVRSRRATAVVLSSLLFLVASEWRAAADPYDDNCTAPANPVLPPSSTATISLSPGQTLVITTLTTFQGRLDSLPTGARVCVEPNATFSPMSINNPQGSIHVRGTANLPGLATASGFALDSTGTVAFTSNLNTNGPATIANGPGGTMTFSQQLPLNQSSSFINDGTATFANGLANDAGTTVDNRGTLTVNGTFTPNGTVLNTGRITINGMLQTNSDAIIRNLCSINVSGGFTNNADLRLSGTIVLGAGFTNQGLMSIDSTGALRGADFTNNRQITGSGRFYFTGNTVNQGPMTGASAASPIVFYDTTSSGTVFDTNNSASQTTNVVRQAFTPPDGSTISPGCAAAGADVETTKAGPASVLAGATFDYTITVSNRGPQAASSITVVDTLPAGVSVVSTGGGVAGAGTVTWTLPTLASGSMQTFVLTVNTGSAGSPMLNVVASTAASADPNPTNNDGSAPTARVSTTIETPPPVNRPPTAISQQRSTRALLAVGGTLAAVDPDPGQTLTWQTTLVMPPTGGVASLDTAGNFNYQPNPGFTGVDVFSARVCDNGSPVLCDVGEVIVLVKPDPRPDAVTTLVDTAITVAVTANDIGPFTNPTVTEAPVNGGTAIVNPDGTITYTPPSGFVGVDTFPYAICAPTATTVCEGTVVIVTVEEPPNAPPVVDDVEASTVAERSVTFTVGASDPDAGQTVSFTTTPISGPANGSVVIATTGMVTYTPNADFAGIDTFDVQACDDHPVTSLCDAGTVIVRVRPDARSDAASTTVDTPVTADVRANDLGAPLDLPTIGSPSPSGTATVDGAGLVTFTPSAGFLGVAEVPYQICVTGVPTLCDSATLVVTVEPAPNSQPVVDDEFRQMQANSVLVVTMQAVDPDLDSVVFTTTPFSAPANGIAAITAGGQVTYTPNAGFSGGDTIVVEACDPSLACSTGTLTIEVVPVARHDQASTQTGVPVVVDILANDVGIVDPPVILNLPGTGTAVIQADGTLLFTPDPDQVGIALIPYEICNIGSTVCDQAVVTVQISPRAIADVAVTYAQQPVIIDAGANDSGGINDFVSIEDPPRFGTVVHLGDAIFDYAPATGFVGTDVFSYARCDLISRLCSTAPVAVIVLPSTVDDVAITFEGQPVEVFVLDNDLGAFASPEVRDAPANGEAMARPVSILYSPSGGFVGADQFTYASCAPLRSLFCTSANVFVTVLPAPNDPPVLTVVPVSTPQDQPVAGAVTATDPQGHAVTFRTTPVSGPVYGTVSIDASGAFVYQPSPGFVGPDSFTVEACDVLGACSQAVVPVQVTPIATTTTSAPSSSVLPPPPTSGAPTPTTPGPPPTVPGPAPPTTSEGGLPVTGTNALSPLLVALFLAVCGALCVLATRRAGSRVTRG